jgi:predicted nucleic acid-binding protein
LDALKVGAYESLASADLLAEWRDVTTRPRVLRYVGLSAAETLAALMAVEVLTRVVIASPSSVSPPDASDAHLWNLLETEPDALLVTGDGPLLRAPFGPGRVITAREAVERLQTAGRIMVAAE